MSEILVLGGENAGKSLFIRRMRELLLEGHGFDLTLSSESTQPTIGVELCELHLSDCKIEVREIGSTLSSQWAKYIPNCSGIIFLIDVSDPGHLSSVIVLLHEVLSNNSDNNKVLLGLNKLDLVDKCRLVMARNFLRLSELKTSHPCVEVISGSCMDGSLCIAAMKWMSAQNA